MGLEVTGNLGKVMLESVRVAKTVAWNCIPEIDQRTWLATWKDHKKSIHIHCEEMAHEKEGPSAGVALTVSIFSLLTRRPIQRTIAMTGEINLCGDVLEIGGLREKLRGAAQAGCTDVVIPHSNWKDFLRITAKENDKTDLPPSSAFRVHPVKRIEEVLEMVFTTTTHPIPPPITTPAQVSS